MSGRRRRSKSLWDRKEENEVSGGKIPWQGIESGSNFHGDGSPKRSNSEASDAFVSRKSMHGNENMPTDPDLDEWENQYRSRPSDHTYGLPYRGGNGNMSKDRERSRSPHRSSRGQDRGSARRRERSPLRDDRNSADRPRAKGRNAYDDQDHMGQSTQSTKPLPCKFFIMGNCYRNNCRFSHDTPRSGDNDRSWNESASGTTDFPISNRNFDDNKSWNGPTWNDLGSGGFDQTSREQILDARSLRLMPEISGSQFTNVTTTTVPPGDGSVDMVIDDSDACNLVSGETNQLETSRNIPQISQTQVLANALEFLNSLPSSAFSGGPVDSTVINEFMKPSVPVAPSSTSLEPDNQMPVKPIGVLKTKQQEPIGNLEVNEKREGENRKGEQENPNSGKSETQGKEEDGNDEKVMRQFKVALVEFVKDILKPTWKEGKMSREVYKTIVKKVVDKVTSTIQGNQIPRTQDKIDQYLAFSKSKITKLVEAYVARLQKA